MRGSCQGDQGACAQAGDPLVSAAKLKREDCFALLPASDTAVPRAPLKSQASDAAALCDDDEGEDPMPKGRSAKTGRQKKVKETSDGPGPWRGRSCGVSSKGAQAGWGHQPHQPLGTGAPLCWRWHEAMCCGAVCVPNLETSRNASQKGLASTGSLRLLLQCLRHGVLLRTHHAQCQVLVLEHEKSKRHTCGLEKLRAADAGANLALAAPVLLPRAGHVLGAAASQLTALQDRGKQIIQDILGVCDIRTIIHDHTCL